MINVKHRYWSVMSRIRFFRVEQSTSLSNYLQTHLQIEPSYAEFLIDFGAIYHNFQRTTENIVLSTGDILRCHTEPKRYLNTLDWSRHITFENEHFLIIDKPAGLPCQPSLDNRMENLLYQLSTHTKQSLFITHRLDIGTKGLVLLAKTKSFQTEFTQKLENRTVTKLYEALTLGPPLASGPMIHWMRPHARSPKILSTSSVEKWKLCHLDILTSQNLNSSTLPKTDYQSGINYYRIQLHTGRTHQIRAQLSFEQNPILGDVTYGGQRHELPFEWQALQCSELAFEWEQQQFHWQLPSLNKVSAAPKRTTQATMGCELNENGTI